MPGESIKEILFRGKRVDNGKWVYGSYIRFRADENAFDAHQIYSYYNNELYDVISKTVGQYTGLKDKNGKKIFEGDIVRYAYLDEYRCYLESLESPEDYEGCNFDNMWTIDVVVYCINIGYPAFDLNGHDWEVNGLSNLSESTEYYFEVIGTIYDNPELLEDKE